MNNTNDYLTATGKIDFNMTNDYMFRVILQENKAVLKGLISSLLHYDQDFIESVEIKNPIVLGENIDEKTYVLDVNVLLNDNTILNLEMQMLDLRNWTDRALNYTCRNFAHLQKGHDYTEAKPVIHIGFLNYSLFPEHPEFYGTYMLLNVKNHQLFSSKIRIGVVNLNQTELATEEDKFYGIDQWVTLFKAKTWEELRMIANEKTELLEATKSLYQYNNEDTIRYQCYAREDYKKMMNTIRRTEEEQAERIEKQLEQIEEQAGQLEEQLEQIEEQAGQLEEQAEQIEELTYQNTDLTSQIAEQSAYIKELEAKLAEMKK